MKHLKKIGALILGMLLLCQAVCFAEATPAELAAKELETYQILIGDESGDLKLEHTVTRAEMATIVCRLLGLEKTAKDTVVLQPVFSDVSEEHWAAGYIQIAKENGILNGYPDGTFLPEHSVSYAEVLKMLLATLGYLPKAESMGNYPHGIIMNASEIGLTKDLSFAQQEPAIRGDIAVLVQRGLDIPLMVQVTFGPDAQFDVMPDLTLRNQHFEMIK